MRYVLHDDATREAIGVFLDLYRLSGKCEKIFAPDNANSSVAKPCVRLNSTQSKASGFYNHSNESRAPTRGTGQPKHARREPGAGPPQSSAPASTPAENGSRERAFEASGPKAALAILHNGAVRGCQIDDWEDWLEFKRQSAFAEWVYFARFGPDVFAWGTASGNGSRLRKSMLFHYTLTGKYDRRVDYLMLKAIYGKPEVWVFEAWDSLALERRLVQSVGNRCCYGGVDARDREMISREIFERFKKTGRWQSQSAAVQVLFQEYLERIYFSRVVHPSEPSRTFSFGDSLEPGFIERTLGRPDLIPAIESVLNVKFL